MITEDKHMLIALALIPAIVLLVYIFKKDNLEKEPMKLLWKCFFWGAVSTIGAILLEELGEMLYEGSYEYGSAPYAFVDAFIVTALAEELCKYVILKKKTWKSAELNCSFDGIVYAVFVSLGFAACENVFYVTDGGFSVAILRMFTAVPLHAFSAVFMGFFYSRAKEAHVQGRKHSMRRNKCLTLIVPILIHGFYDFLLSMDEDVIGETRSTINTVVWILFVIALFIVSFKLVNKASKEDRYFM